MTLNPYADQGRIHRRKGYAIDPRFFLRARYTAEQIAAYKAAYHETGKSLDDRAGDVRGGAYGEYLD